MRASMLSSLMMLAAVAFAGIHPREAHAADSAAVQSVNQLTKKALGEYDELAFDAARKTLETALETCEGAGLSRHPVAADAHLLLGAVLIAAGGSGARAAAIAELRKAREIRPGIELPEHIANPEVQAAFAEAAVPVKRPPLAAKGKDRSGDDDADQEADGDDEDDDEDDDDGAAAKSAHADKSAEDDDADESVDAQKRARARAASPSPSWLIGLSVGGGFGWTSGTGEVTDSKVESGFQPAALAHMLPEVGYFVRPDLLLSLQLRVQFVAGATAERDPTMTICGSDHLCSPGGGATAVLARAAWFLGGNTVRPYLSVAAGGGQIRHVAPVPGRADCGTEPSKPMRCMDTVDSGPVFVGPGGGVTVSVARGLVLEVGLSTLVGFPSFTFNADLNAGFAVEL